ncbi:glycosyltransferase family 2 protein [Cobetia sp. 4B]|uniref:glycosyltransferase n=1 Tax=Cobetia sp. 4B TaxID=2758724 RepID=UPI001C03BE1B|nr:glycosyltransferase family 2 protein [Cobetia sp. 4B]QWN35859.1 glycosyltransferase family 2 protein [Cobetia sp. 4B]
MYNISVIIPAYNVEKYIADTLLSILKQSLLPYEIIVVDDGSTDSTLQVINELKVHSHLPLKVISTDNRGVGEARNIGLKHASGNYVYFLDSDDLVKPEFISEITLKIKNNNFPDIVFFEAESFNDNNLSQSSFKPDYEREFTGYYSGRSFFLNEYLNQKSFSSSPCLYISKLNLWSDNALQYCDYYHEDEVIFHQLILSADTFLVLNDSYYFRRIRQDSIMTQGKNSKHALGIEAVLDSTSYAYSYSKNSVEKNFLKKRGYSFIYKYFNVCKQSKKKLSFIKSLKYTWRFKSPYIFAKLIYYRLLK